MDVKLFIVEYYWQLGLGVCLIIVTSNKVIRHMFSNHKKASDFARRAFGKKISGTNNFNMN